MMGLCAKHTGARFAPRKKKKNTHQVKVGLVRGCALSPIIAKRITKIFQLSSYDPLSPS